MTQRVAQLSEHKMDSCAPWPGRAFLAPCAVSNPPCPLCCAMIGTHQCAFCCASASGTAWSISCCSQGRHTWRDASRWSRSPTARWSEPPRAHAARPARTDTCSGHLCVLSSAFTLSGRPTPPQDKEILSSCWKQEILLRSTSTTSVCLNRFFAERLNYPKGKHGELCLVNYLTSVCRWDWLAHTLT